MSSSADIFNQVRSAVDIVDVIGEHIALKRAGREFKGLCPFHPDRRPSMAVVPHKQIFHCFVCGTGGDVFKFVKDFHKMGNGEALRMLAQRAGIKLPELPKSSKYAGGGGAEKDKDGLSPRERIANTNEWACTFFEKHLRTPQGKLGLDYLHARGLTDETLTKFRLGMSPEGWTGLVNTALRHAGGGISNETLFEAGLIKQRQDSSPYDAFRNRVIFPIIDATGNGGRVVAFGGRILEEKRDEAGNIVEAKYLNSPETKLFNKSESLYGLNLARQHIIRTRTAIIVEGYMDTIACHQAGVTNVVATLGTALTPDHARILKNYAQTIVLVFDSDDAGRRAADRALEVFVKGTLDIKLASVPDGKDPCDFCIKNGGDPFQKLVDNATDALTYKWQTLLRQFHGTDSVSARQEAITQYLRFIAPLFDHGSTMDPIRRGLLLAKIAGLVGMPSPDLQTALKRLSAQNATSFRPTPPPTPAFAPTSAATDTFTEEPAPTPAPRRIDIRNLKRHDAAEGWLLGALLAKPTLYEKVRNDFTLSLFTTFQPLAAVLLEYLENQPDLADATLAELTTTIDDPELLRQAIELEAKTSDWLDPASLSPASAKLVQQLADDRGLSLDSLLQDSLKELQQLRGTTDPAADVDFSTDPALPPAAPSSDIDIMMQEIARIQSRNATGANRRISG